MVERGPRFFSGRQLAPGGIVSRGFVILILCVGVAGAVLLGFVFEQRLATADEYHRQVRLALEEAKRIREQVILPQHEKLSAGQNLKDRKSTRLNSSHTVISYAVFCLKKKNINKTII